MKTIATLVIALSVLSVTPTFAADIEQGKKLSTKCMGCHAVDAAKQNPAQKSLLGKENTYLVDKLTSYRDGTIKSPLMNGLTAKLSDEDIENIAAFYSSL